MKDIALVNLFLLIGISLCSQEFYITFLGNNDIARSKENDSKFDLNNNIFKSHVHNGCLENDDFSLKQETVNVNEKNNEDHKDILPPNPNKNLDQMDGKWLELFLTRYEIYNVVGKLMKSDMIQGSEISLGNLRPGIYIVKLFQGNEILCTSRIIKK